LHPLDTHAWNNSDGGRKPPTPEGTNLTWLSLQQLLFVSGLGCLASLLPATAVADEPWLPLRNHNPFLQIFGLPAFESAVTVGRGETAIRVDFDIANHAEEDSTPAESVTIDGESYYLNLAFRYGMSDKLAFGVDIPFVGHAGGFLDAPIENWHDLWGMSNSKRDGPRNELEFRYDNPQAASYELTSGGFGLGDIRLNAEMPFYKSAERGREAGVRVGLKLPTGDANELRGSGAMDYSLGIYAADAGVFGTQDVSASAVAGVLILGTGDVLPEIQQDTVAFAGIAAAWQATDSFGISTELYAQSSYYESELSEIGDQSIQFAAGGYYVFRGSGLRLSFALIEELFDDATTDVALQFSIRGTNQKAGDQH
jgi:hypothetical protein